MKVLKALQLSRLSRGGAVEKVLNPRQYKEQRKQFQQKKKNKWTGSKRAFFRTSVLSEDVIGLWLWSFSEQTCGPELGMCFFPHVTGKKKGPPDYVRAPEARELSWTPPAGQFPVSSASFRPTWAAISV